MFHIRAAFDIGSSHHKLTVAEASSHEQLRILHQAAIRIPLADALTPNNCLPPYILSASHAALRTLKAAALAYGATHFAAIATQVFRVASNGLHHLTSLSNVHQMSVTILTSVEEGILAFSSVAFHQLDPSNLVVWDSGGASTQWTHRHANRYSVHSLALGAASVRAAYRRLRCVRQLAEWVAAVATDIVDPVLMEKARSGIVLGIGGPTSMFALAHNRVGKPYFGEHDVRRLFYRVTEEDDVEVSSVLPKLVLLAELMKRYAISSVKYIPSNGNCVGLLLSEDPRFWGAERNLIDENCLSPANRLLLKHQPASC